MQKINERMTALQQEIEAEFPFTDMPAFDALSLHKDNCRGCEDLRADLEQYRDNPVSIDTLRLVHQELSVLSAESMLWILPYYLRYCITPEAANSKIGRAHV